MLVDRRIRFIHHKLIHDRFCHEEGKLGLEHSAKRVSGFSMVHPGLGPT